MSKADDLFREALELAAERGYLHEVAPDHPMFVRGVAALEKQDEAETTSEKTELVEWPHWANWRLILAEGDEASAVYFTRKPTYAEKKAFCAIAGISPEKAEAEERL